MKYTIKLVAILALMVIGCQAQISFVQVAEATPQTPQSSVSVSYSQSQTAGDLNIVVVGWNDTTATVQSVTDTQGNTYTLATGPLEGTALTQSIYYAKNIRGGSNSVTATFSAAAAFPDIRIVEYKGLSTTSPLDKTQQNSGTSGNNASVSSGSATTTSANELIFGSAITNGAFTTAGTGFTKEVIDSDGNIVEDETVSSTGSYAATATLGSYGSQNWIMQMATFIASSGGSAPTVTSISPNSGTTAGGTPVTITGTGFISGSTVTIGGTAATGVTVVSSTSITATTPAHAAGAATVVVSNSNGSGQLTNGFTYTSGSSSIGFVQVAEATPQTPQSSVSVSYSQSQTAGNLNIVVVGWNDTAATVQSVTDTQGNTYTLAVGPLKGTALTQSIYYAKNIRGGSNSVTATFSAAAAFPDIRIVEYKGLSTTSPLDKTQQNSGTSGNNASVSSGSATTTSANELIFGSAITNGAFTTAGTGFTKEVIDSDGNIVEDETVSSTGSYAATATLGAFGSQNWIMQMATFVGSSGGGSAPTVTSISPNSGTTAGATPVTITGTGFISGSTVTIGGAAATSVTVVSSTSITAYTPAGSAGAATVVVSNTNGSGQLTNGFTYSGSAPQISSLSPTSGGIGSPIIIFGSNFGSSQGTSTVTFNGISATNISWVSSVKIDATVPSGLPAGNANVVVTVGGVASNSMSFAVSTTPTVTQVSPTQGSVGNAVAITGIDFGTGGTVTFNGVSANILVWSPTSILTAVPSGATTGNLVVTVNGTPASGGSFTVTAAFPVTATAFSYDPMGRVGYKFTCAPSNCGETNGNYYLQHTYDLAGDLATIYNGYSTFDYAIGQAGRVTQVTDNFEDVLAQGPGGGSAPIAYAPNGAINGMLLGSGVTESSVYNNRLQPCRMNVNSAGTVLTTCSAGVPSGNVQDFTYGFTPGADNGNLTSFAAVGYQNFNRSYTYDHFNRLQTMSAPGDACSGLSWTVDPWGNRTQQNITGGTCFQPQLPVNSQNQLMGSPYQYDAAGNLTYDGNHHYTYDAENRIVQVDSGNTAAYVYDASDDRVEKQMPGNDADYLYDGGQVATRWTNEAADRSYVYLGGQPLVHYYGSAGSLTAAYMHTDQLGSTRIETASGQSVVQCSDFYPYGELIVCGKSQYMLKEFTGKERDSESGLDDFEARHYASTMGRFMQTDPDSASPLHLVNPQRWNAYAYVLNNPLAYTDPDGRDAAAVNFSGMVGGAGHEGVMAIGSDGTVTYAEFGPASHGAGNLGGAVAPGAVNIDTNLPKVQFGSDHQPTPESMQAVKAAIAKNDEGGVDPNTVRVNYFQTSDADTMALKNWMREQQEAAQRGQGPFAKYRVWGSQNCATFCVRGLVAGNALTNTAASSLSIVPNGLYWELLGLQQSKPLQEQVTHKICYTDANGKQVCQ